MMQSLILKLEVYLQRDFVVCFLFTRGDIHSKTGIFLGCKSELIALIYNLSQTRTVKPHHV